MRRSVRALLAIALLAGATPACCAATRDVPAAAKKVILEVREASARRDTAALDALMVRDFTWSFGGDADAKQALAQWRAQPRYFDELRRVTGLPCGYDGDIVECPSNAGTRSRAGFGRTEAGWRMIYFVEGD